MPKGDKVPGRELLHCKMSLWVVTSWRNFKSHLRRVGNVSVKRFLKRCLKHKSLPITLTSLYPFALKGVHKESACSKWNKPLLLLFSLYFQRTIKSTILLGSAITACFFWTHLTCSSRNPSLVLLTTLMKASTWRSSLNLLLYLRQDMKAGVVLQGWTAWTRSLI